MEKLLTIIVPTYNMETYLRRCLDSVTCEDVTGALEVIVVNDGSSDDSLAIAKEYERTHPSVVRVLDKPNGNYGSCVNAALPLVRGRYIRLLDADDWVDVRGLGEFLKVLGTTDADLFFSDYNLVDGRGNILETRSPRVEPEKMGKTLSASHAGLRNITIARRELAMHSMTYKTECLRRIGYRQTEGVSYTDSEYVFYPMQAVETVCVTGINIYQYFVGREGQTTQISAYVKHCADYEPIIDRMLGVTLRPVDTPVGDWQLQYISSAVIGMYYLNLLVWQKLSEANKVRLRKLDKRLCEKHPDVYKATAKLRAIKYVPHIWAWRRFGVQLAGPRVYAVAKRLFD